MFTGIITGIGTIECVAKRGDLRIRVGCAYDMAGVTLGASIACSGVCLTVVDKSAAGETPWFEVDVSAETISRVASDSWVEGGRLNLERALKVGDELGGHIVTGHVDGVGEVIAVNRDGDSHHVRIAAPRSLAPFIAAKGSVTLDGTSLTVNTVEDEEDRVVFTINIIPHTAAVTTFDAVAPGRALNIEIDILARYLGRMEQLRT